MNESWSHLESLFHAASALEGEEREHFIESQTTGNPVLLGELRDLLRHANSGTRIAAVVERVAERAVGGSNWVGRIFGPYRIVREIGRGGMGIVFEACRDDSEYYKRVALKVAPDWRDPAGFGNGSVTSGRSSRASSIPISRAFWMVEPRTVFRISQWSLSTASRSRLGRANATRRPGTHRHIPSDLRGGELCPRKPCHPPRSEAG